MYHALVALGMAIGAWVFDPSQWWTWIVALAICFGPGWWRGWQVRRAAKGRNK